MYGVPNYFGAPSCGPSVPLSMALLLPTIIVIEVGTKSLKKKYIKLTTSIIFCNKNG